MRKLIILSFIVVLMSACRKESPYVALSGSVYYEGIAIPVRDVRVKVDQNITYSGSDGRYDLPEIRKGLYTLRADKDGFDSFQFEMEFFKDEIFQNFGMISDVFTSSIYGNIYGDYIGEPRVGLRCVVMNPNGTESRLEAITDSLGFYEIKRVPEGYHSFKVIEDKEVIYQDWIEVKLEDVSHDMVFPDVFMFEDERDGKEYSALKIGSLNWMVENLAYLPYIDDPAEVSSVKKLYYVYGYERGDVEEAKETENYKKYGVLYNWRAAIDACPEGWRLPTHEDWKSLEDSIGWLARGSDNRSWFNALPGGIIGYNGASFGEGSVASFWTSVKCSDQSAWCRSLNAGENGVFRSCAYTRYGYSVRCVR